MRPGKTKHVAVVPIILRDWTAFRIWEERRRQNPSRAD
jgi:hypothetical protein